MDDATRPSLTSVPGIRVGSAEDLEGCTGCTVIVTPPGGMAATAVVRGPAASLRQVGIASPDALVDRVDAVLLAGGSAYGLDAAAGVMSWLEEAGRGVPTFHGRVPVVPTAILYDLGLGSAKARPTAEMARQAAERATTAPVVEGSVGAGTGATVGKVLTVRCATKGGLGSWAMTRGDGLVVGALAAVNAFGDVVDTDRGLLIAGARRAPDRFELIDTWSQIVEGRMAVHFGDSKNTTLAVVATNGRVPRRWRRLVASLAADGLARCLRPAFTAVDGDVVMVLFGDEVEAEPHLVGLLAARALERAVVRAVTQATSLGGLPTASRLEPRALTHGGV